jgi:hypothetical protein
MENKKQTAVEWLVNKLNNDFENNDFLISYANEISQAKEMEKEQIIDSFKIGNHTEMRGGKILLLISEQYYNETYGGNK